MLQVCLRLYEIGERGVFFFFFVSLKQEEEKKKKNFATELKGSSLSMRWRQRLGVWQGDVKVVQS